MFTAKIRLIHKIWSIKLYIKNLITACSMLKLKKDKPKPPVYVRQKQRWKNYFTAESLTAENKHDVSKIPKMYFLTLLLIFLSVCSSSTNFIWNLSKIKKFYPNTNFFWNKYLSSLIYVPIRSNTNVCLPNLIVRC